MRKVDDWKEVVQRFKKRLANWKVKLISIGGGLTLIRYVLVSLGIYYMSMFKIPVMIIMLLKALRATFFWGGYYIQRKIFWISWEMVLNSKDKCGLGVGSLKTLNLAILQKRCWRFVTDINAIWRWKFIIIIIIINVVVVIVKNYGDQQQSVADKDQKRERERQN